MGTAGGLTVQRKTPTRQKSPQPPQLRHPTLMKRSPRQRVVSAPTCPAPRQVIAPAPSADPPREVVPIELRKPVDVYIEYLRIERHLSEHSVRCYAADLANWGEWLSRQQSDVFRADRDQVHAYTADLHDQLAPSSVARRSMYRYLIVRGRLQASPVEGLRGPKQAKTLPTSAWNQEYVSVAKSFATTAIRAPSIRALRPQGARWWMLPLASRVGTARPAAARASAKVSAPAS